MNILEHSGSFIQGQRVIVRALVAGLCIVLGGCAMPQRADDPSDAPSLHRELIVGMLDQGQYYAALAHVQQQQTQSGATPELRYYEAEARRRLGQSKAAEALYQGLLRTDYAGQSHQGLGLLYARTDLNAAVQQLRQAVQRQPANAGMRNDLGYALMMAGRYQEALPQLATAVELDPGGTQSINNLVVLLLLRRDEAGAKRVADDAGLGEQQLAALRKQAQSLAARTRR